MKQPAVYIVTNKRNGTLYIGVTSDLIKRIYEHKEGIVESFTKKYGCTMLVFYELYGDMKSAIAREKQIKDVSRKKKLQLMSQLIPNGKIYMMILFN